MKLIEISKKLEEVIEKSDLYDSIKIFKNEFSILEIMPILELFSSKTFRIAKTSAAFCTKDAAI